MMVISLSPSDDTLQSTLPLQVEEMEGKGPLMGSSASLGLWNAAVFQHVSECYCGAGRSVYSAVAQEGENQSKRLRVNGGCPE